MSVYRVTGRLSYREHPPGTVFEADLPEEVERRAVERGAIQLLRRCITTLVDGSWTLPDGWLTDDRQSSR